MGKGGGFLPIEQREGQVSSRVHHPLSDTISFSLFDLFKGFSLSHTEIKVAKRRQQRRGGNRNGIKGGDFQRKGEGVMFGMQKFLLLSCMQKILLFLGGGRGELGKDFNRK